MAKLPKLDDFHYHELLDRLHVIMCTIDEHIQQHPAAKLDTELNSLISAAQDKLWEAYQLTGSKYN